MMNDATNNKTTTNNKPPALTFLAAPRLLAPASTAHPHCTHWGFAGKKQGGVHAVGHALLAVVPLFLLCDAADVDCEHARPHHNRPQPKRILVYDKRPGGVGVSDAMFGCHR